MEHYNSKEVAESYYKQFSRDSGNQEIMKRAIERYEKFLRNVPETGQILDSGCGTGRFIPYFLRRGYRVTGIDASRPMIDIAVRENPGVELYVMDMRSLTFPDKKFDGVWNSGCILHLDEEGVKATFHEAIRVLKPGGIFYVATRYGKETLCAIEESSEGGRITVNYYTTEKLEELLVKSGFEITDMNVDRDDWGRPFDYCYIYAQSPDRPD